MCVSVPTRKLRTIMINPDAGVSGSRKLTEPHMNIQLSLAPIISLIAGVLILMMPRLLNYIVAFYLIIIGLVGLFGGRL